MIIDVYKGLEILRGNLAAEASVDPAKAGEADEAAKAVSETDCVRLVLNLGDEAVDIDGPCAEPVVTMGGKGLGHMTSSEEFVPMWREGWVVAIAAAIYWAKRWPGHCGQVVFANEADALKALAGRIPGAWAFTRLYFPAAATPPFSQ